MNKRQNFKKTHLYSRTAKSLLTILAAFILLANVVLLNETKRLVDSFSSQQNQATWFLFQLNKELLELSANSTHIGDGHGHLEKTKLKYDLAWSRFDLLVTNQEADDFMSLEGTRTFFTRLFDEFKALDPLLQSIDRDDLSQANAFSIRIIAVQKKLVDYINHNFRVASPLYLEKREQVHYLEKLQTVLLFLLIICIALIIVIFSRELGHSRRLARTDTLTSLPNRLALFNYVEQLKGDKCSFNLFLLDLNGFKEINDKYGHQVGDRTLIEVAKRLSSLRTQPDFAYRIGGDEFAIIVQTDDLSSSHRFCKRLESVFERPFSHSTYQYELSTSVGCANFPEDSIYIDELIRYADQRMYEMKFSHRGRVEERRYGKQ
jgi:diguanylate cyclase (GGDEF)-like protein